MKLLILDSYEELSAKAAGLIAEDVRQRPRLVMLAATGNTPVGAYRHLARQASLGKLDVSQITVAQLDEYVGLAPDDDRSLLGWMQRILIDPLQIDARRVIGFGDVESDAAAACCEHGRRLSETGIDVAVLGLGPNGHLGFNEPPSEASSPTRLVELSPASIASNARYWGSVSRVPRRAVTVGMNALLASRRILLLVSGSAKVEILRRTVESPASAENPASLLRLAPEVTLLADRQAWPWRNGEVRTTEDIELMEAQQLSTGRSGDGG
jgi:glucosamine-6-phosphate deaminase